MPSDTSTLMFNTRLFSDWTAPMWNTVLVHNATGLAKANMIQSAGMPNGAGNVRPPSTCIPRRVNDDRIESTRLIRGVEGACAMA